MEEISKADSFRDKRNFNRLGMSLFSMFLLNSVAYIFIGGILGFFIDGAYADGTWVENVTILIAEISGAFFAYRIMRKIPTAKGEESRLILTDFFVLLLITFSFTYIGEALGTTLASLLTDGTSVDLINASRDTSPITIAHTVLLTPILEEFIFRKQLIDRCVKYGEKTAILFSALCFALAHTNLYQFFYAFWGGLVWGYVYTRTRKVQYTVLMHMLFNLIGGYLIPAISSEALVTALEIGLSAVGLALLFFKIRQLKFLPAEEQLQKGEIFRAVYLNWGFVLFFVMSIVMSAIALFTVTV